MPNSVIKSLAKKSKRPESVVEKMWNDIVDGISKKMKEDDPKFYPTVVSTLKKKLNIKDDKKVSNGTTPDDDNLKGTTLYSGPSVKENFTVGLETTGMDYGTTAPPNGAFFPRVTFTKKKKKVKKRKTVKESTFMFSVGSLKEEKPKPKPKEKPLTEIEKWQMRYGRLPL